MTATARKAPGFHQRLLDFGGLTRNPAALDHRVLAAEEAKVTVLVFHDEVARAADEGSVLRKARVRHEHPGGVLGPVPVAEGHGGPAMVQDTRLLGPAPLSLRRHREDLGLRDGAAMEPERISNSSGGRKVSGKPR